MAVSLVANVYLFRLVVVWQEAWAEQILTTSVIEQIYGGSGADVSYEGVKKTVEREFDQYQVVPVMPSDSQSAGIDEKAILVDGTKLFFKQGQYIGSKAHLPEGLVHWRIDEEF